MKKLIPLLLLFYFSSIKAFENDLFLKGGVSHTWAKLKGLEGSNDHLKGFGFSTHFGYRWECLEFTLSSYIFWGEIEDLTYQAQGKRFHGEGNFRHVSFGPIAKYHFRQLTFFKNYHFYAGLGPSWSLQTITLDEVEPEGSLDPNHKMTYESRGGFLVFGIEEKTEFKQMHPVYYELLYSYKKSKTLSVVDKSDSTKINILSTEESGQNFNGHYIMISMGMTFF